MKRRTDSERLQVCGPINNFLCVCFYFAEKLPDQLCPSLEVSKTNHMFCVALLVPIRKGSRSRKILPRLRRHREAWVPRREA